MSDTKRLFFLSELIRNCPDVELSYNDDEDVEDADGMAPLGFTIRLESPCAGLVKESSESFAECIDKFEKALSQNER